MLKCTETPLSWKDTFLAGLLGFQIGKWLDPFPAAGFLSGPVSSTTLFDKIWTWPHAGAAALKQSQNCQRIKSVRWVSCLRRCNLPRCPQYCSQWHWWWKGEFWESWWRYREMHHVVRHLVNGNEFTRWIGVWVGPENKVASSRRNKWAGNPLSCSLLESLHELFFVTWISRKLHLGYDKYNNRTSFARHVVSHVGKSGLREIISCVIFSGQCYHHVQSMQCASATCRLYRLTILRFKRFVRSICNRRVIQNSCIGCCPGFIVYVLLSSPASLSTLPLLSQISKWIRLGHWIRNKHHLVCRSYAAKISRLKDATKKASS